MNSLNNLALVKIIVLVVSSVCEKSTTPPSTPSTVIGSAPTGRVTAIVIPLSTEDETNTNCTGSVTVVM